jgi:hypothetical protein
LAQVLCRDYVEFCERAGAEQHIALVERIARLVGADRHPSRIGHFRKEESQALQRQ